MKHAVVKDQHLTFDPGALLVTDLNRTAILGHDEWQVTDETRIDHAVVRRDTRVRPQFRKQRDRCLARYVRLRCRLQRAEGFGTQFRRFFIAVAVMPQVVGAPVIIVDEISTTRAQMTAIAFQVGRKTRYVCQHGLEFAANLIGRSLDRLDPLEIFTLVKLNLWQSREVEAAWLLVKNVRRAEKNIK